MEINEIKKALYKEKPKAKIINRPIGSASMRLNTTLSNGFPVNFEIPFNEWSTMNGNIDNIESQFLIRWLVV